MAGLLEKYTELMSTAKNMHTRLENIEEYQTLLWTEISNVKELISENGNENAKMARTILDGISDINC